MADLNKKNNQALEELKRIQAADKPKESALDLSEPELEAFDAASVFEVEEKESQEEEKKSFSLGKHFKKRASRVRVKKSSFENQHVEIEDLPMPGQLDQPEPEEEVKEPLLGSEPVETIELVEEGETLTEVVQEPNETVEEETVDTVQEETTEEEISKETEEETISETEEPTEPEVQESEAVSEEKPSDEVVEVQEEQTQPTPEEVVESSEEEVVEESVQKETDDVVEHSDQSDDDDIQVEFYDEDPQEQESGETQDQTDGSQDAQEILEETEESEEMEYADEDLFFEKRNFLLSQYDQEVKYLEQQSQNGYHFVKREGKNYSFVQGEPKDYYYLINYYEEEPTPEMKQAWKQAGWKLITTNPANKKGAYWYILRNEEQPGQYRKVIENEEEKYQFFRKYASSCRSTMFLIFICMACCLVAGFLQFMFKGHVIGIAISAFLFLIALIAFFSYNRMLKEAKRMSSLLKARLRLRAREDSVMGGYEESDEELDSDWNKVNE